MTKCQKPWRRDKKLRSQMRWQTLWSTERIYRSSALHLGPPAALQAHVGDSLGGKEERGALGRKFCGKEKCNRRKLTGREQPVNLKSLLSEQLTIGAYGLLSFGSSNQNLIYQRDPFSLLTLLFHGYVLVHLVKVVIFQWLSLHLDKSLACMSSCMPSFPDHWWRAGQ